MSKFVSEVINDIKKNPESWVRQGDYELKKDNVVISRFGNGHILFLGWMTSIIEVRINDKTSWGHLSWLDKIRIEECVSWWFRNATIEMLKK